MTFRQMPNVLESMLEQLFKDNSLSSWSINGKDNFTQVTLRFFVGLSDMDVLDKTVKYKKMTLSQRRRESQRSQVYKSKHCIEPLNNLENKCTINEHYNMDTDIAHGPTEIVNNEIHHANPVPDQPPESINDDSNIDLVNTSDTTSSQHSHVSANSEQGDSDSISEGLSEGDIENLENLVIPQALVMSVVVYC